MNSRRISLVVTSDGFCGTFDSFDFEIEGKGVVEGFDCNEGLEGGKEAAADIAGVEEKAFCRSGSLREVFCSWRIDFLQNERICGNADSVDGARVNDAQDGGIWDVEANPREGARRP